MSPLEGRGTEPSPVASTSAPQDGQVVAPVGRTVLQFGQDPTIGGRDRSYFSFLRGATY